MSQIQEVQAFVTSFYTIEKFGANNAGLMEYFKSIPKSDFWIRNDYGGIQTHNTFNRNITIIDELFNMIDPAAKLVMQRWGITRPTKFRCYWFNVEENGEHAPSHYHRNTLLTGVYYLDCPIGSGDLIIERPDTQEHYFYADELNPHNYKYWRIPAVTDKLVMFPSYVKHRTTGNKLIHGGKRISIAFEYVYEEDEDSYIQKYDIEEKQRLNA